MRQLLRSKERLSRGGLGPTCWGRGHSESRAPAHRQRTELTPGSGRACARRSGDALALRVPRWTGAAHRRNQKKTAATRDGLQEEWGWREAGAWWGRERGTGRLLGAGGKPKRRPQEGTDLARTEGGGMGLKPGLWDPCTAPESHQAQAHYRT